jgi:tetratricopeptide (TPR) repeat protein
MSASDLQRDFSTALEFQFARNWTEAERRYRSLLQRTPTEPVIPYNLGLVLKAQGKLAEAIDSFRLALRLNAHFPEAANNLGTTLTATGEIDEAIQILNTCSRENPNLAEATLIRTAEKSILRFRRFAKRWNSNRTVPFFAAI